MLPVSPFGAESLSDAGPSGQADWGQGNRMIITAETISRSHALRGNLVAPRHGEHQTGGIHGNQTCRLSGVIRCGPEGVCSDRCRQLVMGSVSRLKDGGPSRPGTADILSAPGTADILSAPGIADILSENYRVHRIIDWGSFIHRCGSRRVVDWAKGQPGPDGGSVLRRREPGGAWTSPLKQGRCIPSALGSNYPTTAFRYSL